MSLIYCPECGHEVSDSAIACPSCGRPLRTPVVREQVIPPVERDSNVPKWVYIPVAVIGGLVILLLFVLFFRASDDEGNVNLKVSANRGSRTGDATTRGPSTDPGDVTTPETSAPSSDSHSITIPGTSVPVDGSETRGSVVLNARVSSRNGQIRPVRNEKFYLLDKDIESVLSEANLEPIEGNSLLNSFALSVSFPERYGDFNRRALSAIRRHIKHSATSDSNGEASFADVEPDMYYLFGITANSQGFAVWSSPVTIRPGRNNLDLSPQTLVETNG